ncbi:MAG TPA: polysaccharide deacetylase family protein, partial [Polyangiaceae bacterium]|nr:polysaccharide deacetylase family protein [Polyangiaceae bacterium]
SSSAGAGGAAGRSGSPSGGGGAGVAGGAAGAAGGAAGAAGGAGAAGAAGDGGSGAGEDAGFPPPDKLVALTFDDGPSAQLTPAVLDKLELYGVSASFFLIGQNISANTQAVLQRAASLGCTFENHSAGFASLTATAADQVAASVDSTTAAIEQFTDQSPAFFRPPNLAVDQNMFDNIDLPFAGGLVGGDFPGGNNGGNPTVESVTNVILNGVQDGTIILLHDVQPSLNPQVTPDALDIIIPELRSRGYEFVNLRQLFERRGVDPNNPPNMVWAVVPPS